MTATFGDIIYMSNSCLFCKLVYFYVYVLTIDIYLWMNSELCIAIVHLLLLFMQDIKKCSHLTRIAPLTNFAIEYDTCEMLGVMYPCLSEFNLGRYVEPMVWHYTTAESFQLTPGYYCYFLYIICNSVWSILKTVVSCIHSFIHSIGMCRMWQFLAVLRSFFHSSLLCTFSCHPSPPTVLPSSLASSCCSFMNAV